MKELEARKDALEEARNRRRWRLDELARRMKEEYGCDTVTAMKALVEDLAERTEALEADYRRQYAELLEEYPQLRP